MARHYERILAMALSVLAVSVSNIAASSPDDTNKYGFFTEEELKDPDNLAKIEAYWERGEKGEFKGVDEVVIKYISLINDNEKGAVVIANGRTESYIKYKELAYDIVRQGYSVYILDHRGQGFSGRMTGNPQMGHVLDFNHYIEDLKKFNDEVVSKIEHKKKFLLAHSMGGGIAALYLEKYPTDFDAAALSSPMLEPSTAIISSDEFVCGALDITRRFRDLGIALFGMEPRYVAGGGNYKNVPFEDNDLTHSEIRHKIFRESYAKNKQVKLGSPTTHWADNACDITVEIREDAAKVTIPVLVLQAEKDTAVTPEGQNTFCANLKKGGQNECEGGSPFLIKGAYHELFIEKDEYRSQALTRIFEFFNEQYEN